MPAELAQGQLSQASSNSYSPAIRQQCIWKQSLGPMRNQPSFDLLYTTSDTINFQGPLTTRDQACSRKGTQSSPGPHRCVEKIRPLLAQETPSTVWHLWDKRRMLGNRFSRQRLGSQALGPAWVHVLSPPLDSCGFFGFLRSSSFSMLACL